MIFRRSIRTTLVILLILTVFRFVNEAFTVVAQDGSEDACSDLIEDALQLVGTACIEMGRNEACYGNSVIDATLREDVSGEFEDSGDLIALDDLISLVTHPANPDTGTWGIAFIAVQADLPNESDENVTLMLVGDAQLSHDENLEDETPEAFVLESVQSETCDGVPDGLLIHSPEGIRTRIVVNGVELDMSSAAFITAERDQEMIVQGLEGHFDVTVNGQSELINSGFMTTVPLDGLAADGPPTPSQPIDPQMALPIDMFTGLMAAVETIAASDPAFGGRGLHYSDSTLTLNYPEGWIVELVPGDPTTLGFSNDPAYFAAWRADTTLPLSNGIIRGAIYRYAEFASLTGVEGGSSDAVLRAHSQTEFAQDRMLETPTLITIDDMQVTRYSLRLELTNRPTLLVTHYAFGRFIMVVFALEPLGEFEPIIEALIASVEAQ